MPGKKKSPKLDHMRSTLPLYYHRAQLLTLTNATTKLE